MTHNSRPLNEVATSLEPADAPDRGRLNPDWVEALMGLPVGWTDTHAELPEPSEDAVRAPGWPSRPGEPQHAWEPPRTVPAELRRKGEPRGLNLGHRAARLKALGNAVVPAQAYAVGIVLAAVLEAPQAPPPPPVGLQHQPFFAHVRPYLVVVRGRRADARLPYHWEDWATALTMPCVRCGAVIHPFLRRKDTKNRRPSARNPDYTNLYITSTCPKCHRSTEASMERDSLCALYGA